MALTVRVLRDKEANMGSIIPGCRLWLTADGMRLVEDGDPDARFLFCGPTDEISEADAERFGLKAKSPSEDKAVKAPPEDKAVEPKPEPPVGVEPVERRIMEPEVRRQRRRGRR